MKPESLAREQGLREDVRQKTESKELTDGSMKEIASDLNALGINVLSSWEGCVDDRPHVAAPYIDIESTGIKEIESRFEALHGQSGENEAAAGALRPEIVAKNLEERAKLISLLDAFYNDHQASFDARLIIESSGLEKSRITNQGASLQLIAGLEKRAENLKRFQNEMRAFGEFLKQKVVWN